MNEEENQAILELKVLVGLAEYNKLSYKENQSINIVLNLIEKQQKEIEELKESQFVLYGDDGNIVGCIRLGNDVISKDKIKEKIEELENNVKDFEEYWSKDPRQFKKEKCIDYYKLEALKELLGE